MCCSCVCALLHAHHLQLGISKNRQTHFLKLKNRQQSMWYEGNLFVFLSRFGIPCNLYLSPDSRVVLSIISWFCCYIISAQVDTRTFKLWKFYRRSIGLELVGFTNPGLFDETIYECLDCFRLKGNPEKNLVLDTPAIKTTFAAAFSIT